MTLSDEQLAQLRTSDVGPSGNRLWKAIELRELRQADLAAAVGLTQPYISDVVRGRHSTITVENAHKFADYFGCTIEDLFPPKVAA